MNKYLFFFFAICCPFVWANPKDSLAIDPKPRSIEAPFSILCDGCSCSSAGGMGFASMINTQFVGIRYFGQSYLSSDGLYSNSVWYKENFNSVQIWSRFPVSQNFQISALIPYHFNQKQSSKGEVEIEGLGDITVLGMYRVYATKKDSLNSPMHTLLMGAGVKAPTGKFQKDNASAVLPSFQLGTGSWDYLLAVEHVVRKDKLGVNTSMNYIFKSENQKLYRFGNQFNYSSTLFYLLEKDGLTFAPQMGFLGELYQSNSSYRQKVNHTSGDILFGKMGIEIGREKLSVGMQYLLPIYQNLASGRVEAQQRWSINLNYSL